MPVPKVRPGESESKFISRCVSFVVGEGRPQDQAVAICYDAWRKKKMDTNKIEEITEREPVRSQTDQFGGVTGYAEPAQLLGGLKMYEEIDPTNPEHIGPKKDELDELLPVK